MRHDHQPGIYQVKDGRLADEPTVAEGAIWPAFSPDGDVLAWIANGLNGATTDWFGSLRSRDMTSGVVSTVDAPRQVPNRNEWQWVLPNLVQVDHSADGTYFGYLGLRHIGEGLQPAYLRTALGADRAAAVTRDDWDDAPGNVIASFAGEIGGLTPPALPQDDQVTATPGDAVTVDVLANDLGPIDPATLTVGPDDDDVTVVQVDGRPELHVPLVSTATGARTVDYQVCAAAGAAGQSGSGTGAGAGADTPRGCAVATLTVDPTPATPALAVTVTGPNVVPADYWASLPVQVSNTGDTSVADVTVRIDPPHGYFVSDVRESGTSVGFRCHSNPGDMDPSLSLTCTTSILPAHTTSTLALKLGGPPVAGHGDVSVAATAPAPGDTTATAQASHTVTTGDPADIAISQSGAALTDGPDAGDLAVDVTMSTVGGTTAPAGSDATMTFTVPAGAGFKDITAGDGAAATSECTAPPVGGSGEIECRIDTDATFDHDSGAYVGPGIDATHAPQWHIVFSPPPDATEVTVTATGRSDALDGDQSNNTATETYAVAPVAAGADLAASFVDAASAADGGDVTLHPTITVPEGTTATGVVATITVPSTVAFRSLTAAGSTDMSCDTSTVATTGTITCTSDELSASAAWDLVVTAPPLPQQATFTLHVASATADADDTNNSASLPLDLTGPKATPAVTLTGPTAPVPSGTDVPLTIAVASPVDGFTPTGTVTLMVDGAVSGGPASVGTDGSASAHWTATDEGQHQLSAHYNGDESFATADSATLPITVGTSSAGTVVSGMSLSMSGPVTAPLAGQTVALTVTAGNASTVDLAGPTTIDVTLPNGAPAGQHLIFDGTDTPGWTCRSANLKGVTVVTCRTDSGIPAGTKLDPLSMTVEIPETAALGTDLIRYDVRGGDEAHHDQATGTPLALTIGPRRPSHITATLVGAQELSPLGGDYVLDVANHGAGATTGPLTVSVPLPAGLTAQTGVGGPWQCETRSVDPDVPTLTCTLSQPVFGGNSAPGLPLRLTAGADAHPAEMVSLVATARSTDATGIVTGIGASVLRLPVPARPMLQLDATAPSAGTFSLAVHNAGSANSTGPVTVTEQLPAGFTATVDTTGTSWTCGQAGTLLSCTATGLTIPPGGSAGPPDVAISGPTGVAGTFAMSGRVVASGTHSAVTGLAAHVALPPVPDANPATSVTLADSPLYDGEHSTATLHLRTNGTLPIGSDVLFGLVLPPGITVDPGASITVEDDVPEPAAGSISVGFGGGGDFGGGSGSTSHITCKVTTDDTKVACESTFLQDNSIGSVTVPIMVGADVAGTARFYSGIIPYAGLGANVDYAASVLDAGGLSAIGSVGLTKAEVRQFTADAGAPQTQVDSTPGDNGGPTPTVVDLDASGTTDVGRTLTYGWVQTMGPLVTWRKAKGLLEPGDRHQSAFPAGAQFVGLNATSPRRGNAEPLTAPAALGVRPSFTAPLVATDTVLGFRVYVTDGNTVKTADTTVTLTAVADQPPTGTMTARDVTAGVELADGGPTPAVGDRIEVTVTTADPDGDAVQTAVSVLRPANIGTAIAPEPGETAGDTRHFTFAWPSAAPQLTLQAQLSDGRLSPDGTAVASYATLSIGPPPPPIAVTVTGAPAGPATPGQKVTLTAAVTGAPTGAPAPDITWTQVSGPAASPTPSTGSATTVTIPAGVKAGDSLVLQAAAVVGSGADAQAAAATVTIALAPPVPLAVTVSNFGTLTVASGATLSLTALGSGGAAPITYHWTKVTGAGSLSDADKASASYKAGTATGFDMLEVTATDANHQTATQDVPVQIGTAPAVSTAPGTAACTSSGAIGSLFGQQAAAGTAGHYLLKLGRFTVDLGHLDLGGKSCTPDLSIAVGASPGDNVTATLGPLTFSHIRATLSMTKLTLTSATVSTPSEWHLGSVSAHNIVVGFDPFSITGSITWADQLPLLSKPGTASSVSTTIALGKDSLTLSASANVAGGTVSATGAISTSTGDTTLHVTATSLKIFGQAFSGSGTLSDASGHVTGAVTISWAAGKTADLHGLHLTSASLTWDKDGITAQAGATIAGKFTATLKAKYDDTSNWSATVTGGLAADWDVTSGLTLKKSQTSLSGTISDKKGDLTFSVAISISGSWTAGPVTLTNLSASFANSTAPKKSCGTVPKDDIYLTIGGKATIAVGGKSIALAAEACIVPASGAWTIASTATLTGVTLVSDLTLTGISLTVAHQGSQYSAVLVGTATSHGVTGSVQVALIDGSTGLNFLAAATIDLSKLGVSIPGCGALIYSTEAISDLSSIPGLDLGLTATPPSSKPAGSADSGSSGSGATTTTAGGTGGCGGGASSGKGAGKSGPGTSGTTGGSAGSGSGALPGFNGHAFRSQAHTALRSAARSAAPSAAQRAVAPRDVISGSCRSAPVDTPFCFGFLDAGGSLCTFLPSDFVVLATLQACPDTGVTPMATYSFAADGCVTASISDARCFDVGTDGALCTTDDYLFGGDIGMRAYLATCSDGYLPLQGTAGPTGPAGLLCASRTIDDSLCFGTDATERLCTYYPSGFVGIAWLPTCGKNNSTNIQEQDDGDTSCLSASVYDPSCFAVDRDGHYCTPDIFSGADDIAIRQLVPGCSSLFYRALPAADADDEGRCALARVDDGTCFGYEVIAPGSYRLCSYFPDDFADIAWLDTCVRGHATPATQLHGVADVCAMAVANDPSCFDSDGGIYCTIDTYSPDGDSLYMRRLVPWCHPGAEPLLGAPVVGGGGVLGCTDATLDTPSCFGYTSDPPEQGGFCTFDPVQFVGIVVIPPCPQDGSVPVTTYDTTTDPCYAAPLTDAGCFGQNPNSQLCSFEIPTGGGVTGYNLAEYLPRCIAGATAIDTGSGTSVGGGVIGSTTSDSGPSSGPGNTGATGAANNPVKGLGIPAGFTVMGSFTLPISMKNFLSDKLGLPKPLVDSDLIVQANLNGTPVIKATLTAGDGGIVLMHNASNGTKLTLQSISLTISLGGSFGLSAQGGLDLPKPDAKGPTDVAHLIVTAAVSIQVSGIPSITISLSKTGDVWQDAFGVAGLDLGDIAIQGGIVFSSPPTPSIGFGANIVSLPEPWRKPLGIQDNPDGTMEPITFVVNISAANPILQISLGVPDEHTFLEPMQPIASVLPLGDATKQQLSQVLEVDDASLIIAPYGGSVGTFTYTPGFHLRFDATMLGVNVNVKADVGISPPAIDAHVDVGAFGFGGLNMDETQLDLSITPTTGFMAHFTGGLSIGGASTTATLDAKASLSGGMTFDFESNISHIGYGSMLSLDDLDIFGHGSYTSLKQVPSVTFGMTATAHVLGAGMTVYGDVELGLLGVQGFDVVAAPHPVSLGGVFTVGGTGCNAAALAGLPDVPALPADGPCVQLGYHPLHDPIPTVDINGAIHTSAGIDVAASLTLDDTGLAASGTVQIGPLANVDVGGHLYFGNALSGVTACDESSVLDPSAACHQVAVHPGDFVLSAALASQVSLVGLSASMFAGVGHVGNHDWVVGRATLGVLNTPTSPIHGNAAISGAFSRNGTGFHFDLTGAGSITLGGSVTSNGHIIGGYALAGASFEVSSEGCNTLAIPGLTALSGTDVSGCVGFTGTLGQAGGPLPSTQVSGVVATIGGQLRFQAAGAVDIPIAGLTLANASLVAGNMSGPVTVTVSAHAGLGPIVSVDGYASVSSAGTFCISGTATVAGQSGGASACTPGEPHPGVKVWFTTYGFSVSGYIGPNSFGFSSDVHLNPRVAGTFAGITLSAYADFTVHLGLYYHYPVQLPLGIGTVEMTGLFLRADGKVGVHACSGHVCIGPSLDVAIQYNPGFGICVGTSLIVTDIKICYDTSSGLQVVKP